MKFTGCFVVLSLAACGQSVPPVEPPHVLWSADAQSLDNPFPDTRLLTASGAALRADFYKPFMLPKALTAKMRTFLKGYIAAAATEVHGFGNFGPTLIRTSIPVDPASLAGNVARLRKTATGYEVLEAKVVVEHSTDALIGTGSEGVPGFPEFFLARPGVPLAEGEEGLLVVKKGVKGKAGEVFGRGAAWDAVSAKIDLKAVSAALGVPEAEVLIALPQKAAVVSTEYKTLAAWVDTAPGLAAVSIPAHGLVPEGSSTRPVGTWTNADPDWATIRGWLERSAYGTPSTSVSKVVLGDIAAHDLREGGVWRADWVADPALSPVVPLHFVVSVPVGVKPATGWPTVVVGHGMGARNIPVTGDNNSYCLENAQILAARGIACLGIDAPSHNTRGNFVDFLEVEHPAAMRDRFREMTFDLLQLSRTAPSIDVDGDAIGDLDPNLGYFGNSLGGIMGGAFVAIAPRIKFAVLNVPGGGLANILVSLDIRDRIGLLIVSKTDGTFDSPEYYSQFMIFRAVTQPFFEAADPVNLAALLPADRPVLVQEGIGDRTIPNFTTENLGAAMKLQAPTAPISGTEALHVISHEDPAKYLPPEEVKAFNGHDVFGEFEPVRLQAMKFLDSKGREYLVP